MNRALGTVISAVIITACLTACSPSRNESTGATAPSTATAPPSASSTPIPSSPQETPAGTCETAFTDAEYAALTADGFMLDPDVFVLDDQMQALIDDGFGCYWTRGGGDVRVWYAQASQTLQAWEQQKAQLLTTGWTVTDDPMEGVIQASTHPDNNTIPAMIHRDGVTYYASYSDFLGSVAALQD